MRVKGFRKTSMEKLEQEINDWLQANPHIEIIDFRYQYSRGVTDLFSALILYKSVK